MGKKKISGFLLDPLTEAEANKLINRGHKNRKKYHSKRIDRYKANDANYKLEKSMSFEFDELEDWVKPFKDSGYKNIGIRCFFSEYSINEKKKPDYKERSTLVFWLTHEKKGGKVKLISYKNALKKKLPPPASNYGDLKPPN